MAKTSATKTISRRNKASPNRVEPRPAWSASSTALRGQFGWVVWIATRRRDGSRTHTHKVLKNRARLRFHFVAYEHRLHNGGHGFVVTVPVGVELLELLGIVDALFDDVPRQHAARLLGVETDDLVLAVLPVPKYRRDDRAGELVGVDRLEVLVAGEVDDDLVGVGLQLCVELVGQEIGRAHV